jgi:hypothetical protein
MKPPDDRAICASLWRLFLWAVWQEGDEFQMPNLLVAPVTRQQFLDNNGNPLSAGTVEVFLAGSVVHAVVYQDAAGTTPHPWPITLNGGGRTTAPMFLRPGSYHFYYKNALGAEMWEDDLIAQSPAAGAIGLNDFRLTFEDGVPVSSTDQTAKTILYLTPSGTGNLIDLYNADGTPTTVASGQPLIVLPNTVGTMYDVFAYLLNGTVVLELSFWSGLATRAVPLALTTNGVWVKSGDPTRRFLGCVATGGVAGQSADSETTRLLWNAYNQVDKYAVRVESTSSWAGSNNGVWRLMNNSGSNSIQIVIGLPGVPVSVDLNLTVSCNTASIAHGVGLGLDSATAITAKIGAGVLPALTSHSPMRAAGVLMPTPGLHTYNVLENSNSGAVSTFFGSGNAAFFENSYQPGIVAQYRG